jgi:hypothetical protein
VPLSRSALESRYSLPSVERDISHTAQLGLRTAHRVNGPTGAPLGGAETAVEARRRSRRALATLEDLLGMAPMSTYDARATGMWPSFKRTPNLKPYEAITPSVVPFGAPGAPGQPFALDDDSGAAASPRQRAATARLRHVLRDLSSPH